MFPRKFFPIFFVFLFSLPIFAEFVGSVEFDENAGKAPEFVQKGEPHLAIEWALPLKKNQVQVNRREEAGVTLFGDDILVAARSGELHLFGKNGELKVTAVFEGECTVAPVAVDETHALVSVSNSVFMMELITEKKGKKTQYSWKVLWNIAGKATVAAQPFVYENKLVLIQFHDSVIYVVDKESGELKNMYSDYENSEELSVVRLAQPIFVDGKIVFGFSDGTITFFMLRDEGKVDLIPYYKFKTASSMKRFEKRDFFDILSFVQIEDSILFSGGEYGGVIVDGKPAKLENMEDLQLFKYENGFAGFGRRGIFLFDENGKFKTQPFKSMNYVTNLVAGNGFAVAMTSGEGPMLGDTDAFIYLLSPDFTKIHYSMMIPNGVSSNVVCDGRAVYFISDMGVLYKLKVLN
ncbi:PQQ-binding-like beta-propeller repeat protein [bacterium]|nr:PQQ-binding-like beta-propeller repeat protein [bacterium]